MPELSQVLPIISLLIAAAALWRNLKGDSKADQAAMTTVIVKLETINDNIKEVRSEMRDVKTDLEEMRERMVKVEQSAKSAHKRIDAITGERMGES